MTAVTDPRRCTKCTKVQTLDDFSKSSTGRDGRHSWCKECHRKHSKGWYQKHKNWWPEWKRKNPERVKATDDRYRDRLKRETMAAYGGKCSCCGEDELEFLTIEHVNHDGKAHRERCGPKGIYADLKRSGYPKDGYTVFCWNCQMATRFGATCPHKEKKDDCSNGSSDTRPE